MEARARGAELVEVIKILIVIYHQNFGVFGSW
jgi:hypothetical protein